MNFKTEIIKDLITYLTDGKIDNTIVDWYDGSGFPANAINNKSFQFITKYEDAKDITDPNIIPVLLVTLPEKYWEGEVLYKGNLTALKDLLVTSIVEEEDRVNFFVVPQISLLTGNHLGSVTYDILVDYNSDYDVYGAVADEVSQIIKLMYYKKRSGDYYNMKTTDGRPLFFMPTSIEAIRNDAILGRIKHKYIVKGCNFS